MTASVTARIRRDDALSGVGRGFDAADGKACVALIALALLAESIGCDAMWLVHRHRPTRAAAVDV